MKWKIHERKQRGYYHGNLREALIEAALSRIAEKGPAGLIFAEATPVHLAYLPPHHSGTFSTETRF